MDLPLGTHRSSLKSLNSEEESQVVGRVSSNCCFTWTIDNFSFYNGGSLSTADIDLLHESQLIGDTSTVISSPEFPGEHGDKTWRLRLHPFGAYNDEKEPYISVNLILTSYFSGNENDVNFEISVLNDLDEKVNKFTARRIQFGNQLGVGGYNRFFILRRDLTKDETLLPEDRLRIHCKIWYVNTDEPACCHPNESISTKFWKLRIERKLVDFIINVQGKEFHVHKAIMAIGSPVFASFLETENDQLDVTDCDPEVFEKLVRFIYLGCTNGVKHFELRLLALAEKFGVENLKLICEESMIANITVDNAVTVFMAAEINKALILKPHTLDFIREHVLEIIETDGWKSLLTCDPYLVNIAVSAVAVVTKRAKENTDSWQLISRDSKK